MKELGKRQLAVLNRLHKEGVWYPGCGWLWTTSRETEEILLSLVDRGLVKKVVETRYVPA